MTSTFGCFALLACILMENSAGAVSDPQCHQVFHGLQDPAHPVTDSLVQISLTNAGVPQEAIAVVVYAKIKSGYATGSGDGNFVVNLVNIYGEVQDERKLYYFAYNDQKAISYNSENMVFPLYKSKRIEAILQGATSAVVASVQIFGYYTLSCEQNARSSF